MIDLKAFHQCLHECGLEFITGVPDTLLNDFCLSLDTDWRADRHVIAANEGNAVALAAGYHLATGTVPLVYMQNSGMGNAVNPLVSLADPAVYAIPMVLLIGWRGEPGSGDWPQHQRQGELSPILLDVLGIPYQVLEADEKQVHDATRWAVRTAREASQPTALLVRKNVLARKEKAGFDAEAQAQPLSREAAIRLILSVVPPETLFVASTGRATRELHAIREELGQSHKHDFLNIGAMGHALSIAAGIATGQPGRQVICLDGDGASIMHLGSLPVTANLSLGNLIHIVLNNGAHESVGGQPTTGYRANLNALAAAVGFKTMPAHADNVEQLLNALVTMLSCKQPAFIEIRVRKGMRTDMPILTMIPKNEKRCFMQ